MSDLDLTKMTSVSMDGPNVNWLFFEMLQKEHAEHFGGAQVIVVGSCGLHTVHNAVKCGFNAWQMEKVLRALHTIFLNVPAKLLCLAILWSSLGGEPSCGGKGTSHLA